MIGSCQQVLILNLMKTFETLEGAFEVGRDRRKTIQFRWNGTNLVGTVPVE